MTSTTTYEIFINTGMVHFTLTFARRRRAVRMCRILEKCEHPVLYKLTEIVRGHSVHGNSEEYKIIKTNFSE